MHNFLKPCSCGGKVHVEQTAGGAHKELPTYGVSCIKCNKPYDYLGSTKREATTTWNNFTDKERSKYHGRK